MLNIASFLGEVWKWWLRETLFIYNKASWRNTWQILLRYTVHPRKLTWQWKITISTRRYIFIHGCFSIVIFVFGGFGCRVYSLNQRRYLWCFFGVIFCIPPRRPLLGRLPALAWDLPWVVPLPSNSGKWRFRLGFPTKHETILVVTITGKGDNPRFATVKRWSPKSASWVV